MSIQSLSLPPESRRFGQPHETWLIQVVTQLAVVHSHFAINSPTDLIGLELLQSNVALFKAEVDAIYLGTMRKDRQQLLVCCEMKGASEELDEDQIERGSRRVAETRADLEVIPMGVKALSGGLIWVVEFDSGPEPLSRISQSVFRPEPAVQGIG